MTLRHSLQGEREARLELRSDDKIFCRIRVNCCSFWSWSSCGCSMNGAAAERSRADNSKWMDFIFSPSLLGKREWQGISSQRQLHKRLVPSVFRKAEY